MFELKDISGKIFGRLTAISRIKRRTKHNKSKWLCKCLCGSLKAIELGCLTSGNTKSCGCLRKEWEKTGNIKHGKSRTPEYKTWYNIRSRCSANSGRFFKLYGRRGIKICDRWKDFIKFFEDMGPRPSEHHSVDRINNYGNYEPSNCRWATNVEQANNKRTNRVIYFNGKYKTSTQWSRELGIPRRTITSRLDRLGWTIKDAMTHKNR